VGAPTGAAWGALGDSVSSGAGLGSVELITVSTRFVHTAGLGLPVAAYAVSATMPVKAMASASGASLHARIGAAAVR
jgi:hypothetical protein